MNTRHEHRRSPVLQFFANFIILGEVAEGGMGVVYDARDVRLNKRVALKLIRSGTLATDEEVRRFRAEAEAVARLEHPNIVPVYEAGEHDGQHYVSMKLVEGGSLAEQLRSGAWRPGSRPELDRQRTIAVLLAKAAQAVHHAHQRGVIHRDLKPGNILLDEAGEPYLADFGLAKLLEGGLDLTRSEAVLGTPAYMAPEQASGRSCNVTTAADTYSLGAVLYELLAGQPLFRGETPGEVIEQVRHNEPTPPRALWPAIARDLEVICLKCLEKEPERRYGSAEDLALDLERWLSNQPIRARPVTVWEQTVLWMRRRPVIAALSATVALSLALGLAGIAWAWRQAVRHRLRSEATTVRLRLQRAEDHFTGGNSTQALAELASLLRDQPTNRVAAERLLNALDQQFSLLPTTNASSTPERPAPFFLARLGLVHLEIRHLDGSVQTLSNAHAQVIRSLTHSPDGTRILSAAADGKARLWPADLRYPPTELDAGEALNDAALAPDGLRVVTAGDEGTAQLWDVATGGKMGSAMRHPQPVETARFSPDGYWVLTACGDGNLRLWEAVGGGLLSVLRAGLPELTGASFGLDASWVTATNADGQLRHYRLRAGVAARSVTQSERTLAQTSLSVGGTPELRRARQRLAAAGFTDITLLVADPSGRVFATASSDKSVRLWEARLLEGAQTVRPLAELPTETDDVNCIRFSPDGLRVVTSTAGKTFRWWDVATGQPLSHRIRTQEGVPAVAFSPDGDWVIPATKTEPKRRVHRLVSAAPPWLHRLAEAVGQVRIRESGLSEPVPERDFFAVKDEVLRSEATNPVTAWAKEFLADERGTPTR